MQLLHSLCFQRTSNCHSVKFAEGYDGPHAHENYASITKTLKMDWSDYGIPLAKENFMNESQENASFTIKFTTESVSQVEFQVSIWGEKLDDTYQVNFSKLTCEKFYAPSPPFAGSPGCNYSGLGICVDRIRCELQAINSIFSCSVLSRLCIVPWLRS